MHFTVMGLGFSCTGSSGPFHRALIRRSGWALSTFRVVLKAQTGISGRFVSAVAA